MERGVLPAAVVLLVCACFCPGAPKEPMQVPTTVEALAKIVQQLKGEAEAFAKGGDDKAPKVSKVVKRLQYSRESAQLLVEALKGKYGDPLTELYVIYQLLQPLKMAGNETIRPAKTALLNLLNRRCRYERMPRWPRAKLAILNPPPNLPADELIKRMQKVHQLRREKTTAERPIIKRNRVVRAVETTVKRLLAMLGDASADEALLKRLAFEETHRLTTYEDTLAAIKAQAEHMKQPRAKRIYEQLKAMAYQVGRKKHYLDPTSPKYSLTGNSGFDSKPLYFAVSTLQVVNIVATFAKQPAVPIPDVKKFEARRK